ncbi:hypothetical protein RhiJN_28149 [Ceratobasidium sp. AG-Ba]|nr:hypothetical protein RhiJN_28149 [Ceratobasidium sp. AG-Ba]
MSARDHLEALPLAFSRINLFREKPLEERRSLDLLDALEVLDMDNNQLTYGIPTDDFGVDISAIDAMTPAELDALLLFGVPQSSAVRPRSDSNANEDPRAAKRPHTATGAYQNLGLWNNPNITPMAPLDFVNPWAPPTPTPRSNGVFANNPSHQPQSVVSGDFESLSNPGSYTPGSISTSEYDRSSLSAIFPTSQGYHSEPIHSTNTSLSNSSDGARSSMPNFTMHPLAPNLAHPTFLLPTSQLQSAQQQSAQFIQYQHTPSKPGKRGPGRPRKILSSDPAHTPRNKPLPVQPLASSGPSADPGKAVQLDMEDTRAGDQSDTGSVSASRKPTRRLCDLSEEELLSILAKNRDGQPWESFEKEIVIRRVFSRNLSEDEYNQAMATPKEPASSYQLPQIWHDIADIQLYKSRKPISVVRAFHSIVYAFSLILKWGNFTGGNGDGDRESTAASIAERIGKHEPKRGKHKNIDALYEWEVSEWLRDPVDGWFALAFDKLKNDPKVVQISGFREGVISPLTSSSLDKEPDSDVGNAKKQKGKKPAVAVPKPKSYRSPVPPTDAQSSTTPSAPASVTDSASVSASVQSSGAMPVSNAISWMSNKPRLKSTDKVSPSSPLARSQSVPLKQNKGSSDGQMDQERMMDMVEQVGNSQIEYNNAKTDMMKSETELKTQLAYNKLIELRAQLLMSMYPRGWEQLEKRYEVAKQILAEPETPENAADRALSKKVRTEYLNWNETQYMQQCDTVISGIFGMRTGVDKGLLDELVARGILDENVASAMQAEDNNDV